MRTTLTLRNTDAGHRAAKTYTVHIAVEGDTEDYPQTLCNRRGTMPNVASVQGRRLRCKRCEAVYKRHRGYEPGLFDFAFDK